MQISVITQKQSVQSRFGKFAQFVFKNTTTPDTSQCIGGDRNYNLIIAKAKPPIR